MTTTIFLLLLIIFVAASIGLCLKFMRVATPQHTIQQDINNPLEPKNDTNNQHNIDASRKISSIKDGFDPITCETKLMRLAKQAPNSTGLKILREVDELDLIDQDSNGLTAIMHAIAHDQTENVTALLQNPNIDVLKVNMRGTHAFSFALKHGNTAIIKKILLSVQQNLYKHLPMLQSLKETRSKKKVVRSQLMKQFKRSELVTDLAHLKAQLPTQRNALQKTKDQQILARHQLYILAEQRRWVQTAMTELKSRKNRLETLYDQSHRDFEATPENSEQDTQSVVTHQIQGVVNPKKDRLESWQSIVPQAPAVLNNFTPKTHEAPENTAYQQALAVEKTCLEHMEKIRQEIEQDMATHQKNQRVLHASIEQTESKIKGLKTSMVNHDLVIKNTTTQIQKIQRELASYQNVDVLPYAQAKSALDACQAAHKDIKRQINQIREKWTNVQTMIAKHFNQAVQSRHFEKIEAFLPYTNRYTLAPKALIEYFVDVVYTKKPKLSAHLLKSGAIATKVLRGGLDAYPLAKERLEKFEATQHKVQTSEPTHPSMAQSGG